MYGKKVVSVFGVPLFTKDSLDDVPDVPAAPDDGNESDSGNSGGFLSSIFDSLNPFSSSKR
jgi:hypothetical protein